MSRARSSVMALAALTLVITGCAAKQTKWTAEAAQYAVYAQQIPLYPGTKIADAMGSESWGDEPDSYSYGMAWWCEAKATKDQLVEWYETMLPKAARGTDDLGATTFTIVPEGASPNENMGVSILEDGKYRVFEHTKQKKQGT